MSENTVSRFITQDDFNVKNMIYPIPTHWWSRPYEYAWASRFALPNDTVLDAACGLPHHFKFFLAGACEHVSACDFDERITDPEAIRAEVLREHGQDALDIIDNFNYIGRVNFSWADITQLPYKTGVFDKVFCISVLEHLESEVLTLSTLKEFKRVLRDDGLIVITYDFPDITPEIFTRLIKEAGLEYVSNDYETVVPDNAIYSGEYSYKDLRCYRALLRKV